MTKKLVVEEKGKVVSPVGAPKKVKAVDHLDEAYRSLKHLDRFRGQTDASDHALVAIAHAVTHIAASVTVKDVKE